MVVKHGGNKWGFFMGAKLMNITPITVVYRGYIELLNGVYKPTYDWGGAPTCMHI